MTELRSVTFRSDVQAAKPEMGPGDRVLLDEACRLLDRLDRFEALLDGDRRAWARIDLDPDGTLVLVIGQLVGEARHTTSELRQVVKALNLPTPKSAQKGGVLDDLARRRQERSA